jgi:hypothetical protein
LELETGQHLPTFGGDDEYTMDDRKMDRSSNGMQKTPNGRGHGDKFGASNYSRGLSTPTPSDGSFRGKTNRGRSSSSRDAQIIFFVISKKSLIPAGSIACFPSKKYPLPRIGFGRV